jgi:polysaccharide export outer membrane protein
MALVSAGALVLLAVAAFSPGCASGPGVFVWPMQLPPDEVGASEYRITNGDVVSVRVYGQDGMSTHAKVRSDGRIAVPFLGDVAVAGKTPAALAKEVETGLKSYVTTPNVTVSVDEFQPITVSVIGEVSHPGTVAIDRNTGILQVLASSGGLTENADRDHIFVLRNSPVQRRIRFTYDLLTHNLSIAMFRLHAGDIVVVE